MDGITDRLVFCASIFKAFAQDKDLELKKTQI